MDDSYLRCTLCQEKYGDDRVPRDLGCGHCLCTSCAEDILGKDKACPECRGQITSTFASDLVVNFALLRLTRTLASVDVVTEERTSEPIVFAHSEADPPQYMDVNTMRFDMCELHNDLCYYRCMICCKWICKDCWSVSHLEPPRGPCRVITKSKALGEMKTSFIDKAGIKFKSAKQLKLNLDKDISAMVIATEQYQTTTSSIKATLEEIEENFRSHEVKLESQNQTALKKISEIQDMVELMQQTGNSVRQAKTVHEILETIELANDVLESAGKCLDQEKHRPIPALPKFLSHGKYNLQGILDAGKQVYASFETGGRHRFAQVTGKDGMLYLHALEDGAHSSCDASVIPYKTVRQLVPIESATVFLDVGIAGILKGRVHIRMFGNTARSRQMMLLCSGEQGPCYKYSCFYRVDRLGQPLEILRGGDYESNNGSGGKSIIPGITSGGVYKTEVVVGLLVGWPSDQEYRLGSFDIFLHQAPGYYDNSGHGIVTSGIEILGTVARHYPVKDSVIGDCGLVIHL